MIGLLSLSGSASPLTSARSQHHPEVCSVRINIPVRNGFAHNACPASLDEQAFRRLPEVGAAPDMIEDDLPTNPDYLDEHFGAAAGLREFSDDEFEESDPDSPSVVPEAERPQGATSAYGGETVRILRPEGLHIVENYFDTLPPDPGEAARYVIPSCSM